MSLDMSIYSAAMLKRFRTPSSSPSSSSDDGAESSCDVLDASKFVNL